LSTAAGVTSRGDVDGSAYTKFHDMARTANDRTKFLRDEEK